MSRKYKDVVRTLDQLRDRWTGAALESEQKDKRIEELLVELAIKDDRIGELEAFCHTPVPSELSRELGAKVTELQLRIKELELELQVYGNRLKARRQLTSSYRDRYHSMRRLAKAMLDPDEIGLAESTHQTLGDAIKDAADD